MEPIRPGEINEIIRKQIENFETGVTVTEVGTVIKIGDGIAELHGLEKVMAGELLEFPHDVRGLALNLEEDKVGAVLFGEFQAIREGDLVKRTGRIMQVPVGEALVGRVVDVLGNPIDDAGPVVTEHYYPVERIAPGVVDRQPVKEPLQTGLKALDAMVPPLILQPLVENAVRHGVESRPDPWGRCDIKTIRVAGADVTASMRFIAPDDGNAADRTVMSVPLAAPAGRPIGEGQIFLGRALIEVLAKGDDIAVATHHTKVHFYYSRTVEVISFEAPALVAFRHLAGPVPHAVEQFALEEADGGTELRYGGEVGIDFFFLGRIAGRYWVRPQWERAVSGHLDDLKQRAELLASRRRSRGLPSEGR